MYKNLFFVLSLFSIASVSAMKKDIFALGQYDRAQLQAIALVNAAIQGNEAMVQRLIGLGVDVNRPDPKGHSALIVASQRGQLSIVKMLLKNGANVNVKKAGNDYFALLMAVAKGYYPIVKLLLDNGADINMVGMDGATALHMAALYGHDRIVRLLLVRGADRNLLDAFGRTPLNLAQMRGHVGVVRLLTQEGSAP